MRPTPCLLTIAGTDPSGGAGIQVDLQVFRDFGFHGLSVISAIVCQSTAGVRRFEAVEPALVADQLETLLDDITPVGVKIGMLPTAGVVEAVAEVLASLRNDSALPVVFDPVLASSSEHELVAPGCLEAMRRHLIPQVDLLTPNLHEAEVLLGRAIETRAQFDRAAADLLDLGCRAVLLKAGHLSPDDPTAARRLSDVFADAAGASPLAELPAIADDVRGTGCQLSSAILASLVARAGGAPTLDRAGTIAAIEEARQYLNRLLHTRRRNIGRGRLVISRADSNRPPDSPNDQPPKSSS